MIPHSIHEIVVKPTKEYKGKDKTRQKEIEQIQEMANKTSLPSSSYFSQLSLIINGDERFTGISLGALGGSTLKSDMNTALNNAKAELEKKLKEEITVLQKAPPLENKNREKLITQYCNLQAENQYLNYKLIYRQEDEWSQNEKEFSELQLKFQYLKRNKSEFVGEELLLKKEIAVFTAQIESSRQQLKARSSTGNMSPTTEEVKANFKKTRQEVEAKLLAEQESNFKKEKEHNQRLEQTIKRVQQALTENECVQKSQAAELQIAKNNILQIQSTWETVEKINSTLQKDNLTKQQECERLQEKIGEQIQLLAKLEKDSKELNSQIEGFKFKLEETQNENLDLKNTVNLLQKKLAETNQENSELKKYKDEHDFEIKSRDKMIDELQERYTKTEKHVEQLKLNASLSSLKARNEKTNKDVSPQHKVWGNGNPNYSNNSYKTSLKK